MLLDSGLQFKARRVKKKKELEKRERTHCPSVRRERIAQDIRITGHNTVKSISINHPKEIWRVNGLTDNRLHLLQFSTIRSHDKQGKEEKKKRLNIYLSSKGRHEESDVKILMVQPLKKPPGIGNATLPRVVLGISHGM